MAGSGKSTRVRGPVISAFREAFKAHDAKVRIDERDETGARIVAGRRTAARSAVTEAALRGAVSEHLETLMNTINLDATLPLDDHAAVRGSILNFGFPDVMHRTSEEMRVGELGAQIREALLAYEPRLVPSSIEVARDAERESSTVKVRFVIRADLNCDPLNVPVEFMAEVERDVGKITVTGR